MHARIFAGGGHASDIPLEDQFEILRSLPHAHVAAVLDTLRGIGLHQKLERKSSESRALAIALIAGRILFPGSKLALSRHLSPATAISTLVEELGLGEVDEHDLYQAMRWLFDQRDLAEITSEEHFPGERLVVCRNPTLAAERDRKRTELLAVTEEKLHAIAEACRRARAPYRGKDKIARRVERECAKHNMLKHFRLEITETSLQFDRDEEAIAKAASKTAEDGLPAHSFATLLRDLATLCRTAIRPAIDGAKTFHKFTRPPPCKPNPSVCSESPSGQSQHVARSRQPKIRASLVK